jgi:hypothetical protein
MAASAAEHILDAGTAGVSFALWQRMNGPAGYTPLSWRSSAAAVRSFSRVISASFMRRACIALHAAPAPNARKSVCSTRSEARALAGMQGQKTTLPHYCRVRPVHGTRFACGTDLLVLRNLPENVIEPRRHDKLSFTCSILYYRTD